MEVVVTLDFLSSTTTSKEDFPDEKLLFSEIREQQLPGQGGEDPYRIVPFLLAKDCPLRGYRVPSLVEQHL